MDAFAATTAREPMTRRVGRALTALAVVMLGGLASPLALAADEAAAGAAAAALASPAAVAAPAEAELVVNNRAVMTFRATVLGVTPAERAKRGRVRILEQISATGPLTVTVKSLPMGEIVLIDDSASFAVVTDDDADIPPNPARVAEQAAQALRLVIAEARESRDIHVLWRAVLYAALATALLAAALWLVRGAERKFAAWGVSIALRHGERMLLGQAGHLLFDKIGPMVRAVMHVLWALVVLVLVYEWLVFVLGRFALTRAWSEQLNHFLFRTLRDLGAAVIDAMPGLFTALLIFYLARLVVRSLDRLFDRVQSRQLALSWLDPDLARPTRRIANTAIWLFALAMAYPYLPGAQTDAFKGLSVLVGLMLSLGASNLVGQGASGLILTYSRVIRAGEYVRVAEHEGTVVEMGMFTTRVRTGLGEELTLPNSLILGNVTKNYSRTVKGHGFILDTTATIGYDTPWRQVQSMLVEAALRTPGVLAEPAPQVFQIALSDFYPEYRLVCQAIPTEPRPRAEVLSLLHANIQDVFAEHGVQIMSPHYFGDPGQAKVPPLPDAVGGRAA